MNNGQELVDLLDELKAALACLNYSTTQDPEVESLCDRTFDLLNHLQEHQLELAVFRPITSLVPDSWRDWFWVLISDNAPFSWGDNNRTLVTASDFARHCEDRLLDAEDDHEVPQARIDEFLKSLWALGEAYIDLEN